MTIFQQLNFYQQLIALLAFLVIVSFTARQLTVQVLTRKRRLKIAAVCAVLLTVITLFFLQGHSIFFKEEGAVISKVNDLKKEVKGFLHIADTDQSFFKNNFVFINTAASPTLVAMKEGYAEDSSLRVITDRRKLVRLLRFLDSLGDKVDMVACDIVFPDHTPEDSGLVKTILSLQQKNKIVIAYNKTIAAQNDFVYHGQVDASVLGDVTKVQDEPFYFSHTLYNDEGIPSLPYAIYLKLYNPGPVRTSFLSPREGNDFIFKNFITEFNFTDENDLYGGSAAPAAPSLKIKVEDTLRAIQPASSLTMGRAVSPDGQQEITDLLSQKPKDSKTIFFIGNIRDEFVDRHATAHGLLYGSTILLNEFYYISKKYHSMSLLTYIVYTLVILLSFFLIVLWVLWKAGADDKRLPRPVVQEGAIPATGSWRKWYKSNMSWLTSMFGFLLEEFHHFWLLLFVFLIDLLFHKLINVMGLVYIFLVFSALLKYYVKQKSTAIPTAAPAPPAELK